LPPLTRVALSTGVELDVAVAGPDGAPPVILLHGFPESHRTWARVLPDLARDHRVLAPDQRGYARSSKPPRVEDYAVDRIVDDAVALADAFGIGRFTLVGHDWGGAAAWAAALSRADRVARLAIVNAPHPHVFQRSLFDDPAQRAASQYITRFRDPGFEAGLAGGEAAGGGLERFFDTAFGRYGLGEATRAAYLDEWSQPGAMTAMLNWYRASPVIVPATDPAADGAAGPPAFLRRPFPPVTQPTLVVWGTRDTALTPVQLDGLDAHVPDLTVERVDAGHFVPWEAPEPLLAAFRRWEGALAAR